MDVEQLCNGEDRGDGKSWLIGIAKNEGVGVYWIGEEAALIVLIWKANRSLMLGIRRRGELAAFALLQLIDLLLLAQHEDRSRE